MTGWHHANAARFRNRLARRAVFMAAIQSGESRQDAADRLGISDRTAGRYVAAERR